MRAFIAAFVVFLTLAGGAVAVPPQTQEDPYTNFLVARVLPNGNEIKLGTFQVTDTTTTDAVIRAATYEFVKVQTVNNPAWRILVYGPIDPPSTYWTAGDVIWDSAVNQVP